MVTASAKFSVATRCSTRPGERIPVKGLKPGLRGGASAAKVSEWPGGIKNTRLDHGGWFGNRTRTGDRLPENQGQARATLPRRNQRTAASEANAASAPWASVIQRQSPAGRAPGKFERAVQLPVCQPAASQIGEGKHAAEFPHALFPLPFFVGVNDDFDVQWDQSR